MIRNIQNDIEVFRIGEQEEFFIERIYAIDYFTRRKFKRRHKHPQTIITLVPSIFMFSLF